MKREYMKKVSKTTAALMCAAIITVSGCSQNSTPAESTTTAAQTTTTTAEETTASEATTTTSETAETTASETTTTADESGEAAMIRETLGDVLAYSRPEYMVKEEIENSHSYILDTDEFYMSTDISLSDGSVKGTADAIMETADELKEKVEDSFPNCLASDPEKLVSDFGVEEVIIDFAYSDEYEGENYSVTGSIVFIPSGEYMAQANFVYMDISDNGENYENLYYDFLDIIYSVELIAPETSVTEAAAENNDDPIYDSDPEKHPFKLGVWLVNPEADYEHPYWEAYYCFKEGGHGGFLSQDAGIGLNYRYEMVSEDKIRFEVGMDGEYFYEEIIEKISDDCFRVKNENSEISVWTYLAPPTPEFSFYDNQSLGEMARFIYGMGQYSIADPIVETGYELGMISVVIRDPSVGDYAKSILEWYNIDRYTGKGHDVLSGDSVDLTVLEGSWADMPEPHCLF